MRGVLSIVLSIGVALGTGLSYGYRLTMSTPQSLPMLSDGTYSRIHLGMSPTEARSILGPGTEVGRTETEVVILWRSLDGYTVTATFKESQLVEKEQSN